MFCRLLMIGLPVIRLSVIGLPTTGRRSMGINPYASSKVSQVVSSEQAALRGPTLIFSAVQLLSKSLYRQ
ncbi:MAG: hypothetical protein FWG69_05635 [Oscillospiraceae bacterium]|nr:hypothetical protein [Oscillospiraceae bacterium]